MIRKITLGISLLFSTLMFASPAYADWVEVAENVDGTTYYVDFERMRTNGGYVYYWRLSDYLEPTEYGDFSSKVYNQGDCEMFRRKALSFSFHKQPMGEGSGQSSESINKEWKYPPPNSSGEEILKQVCKFAETL